MSDNKDTTKKIIECNIKKFADNSYEIHLNSNHTNMYMLGNKGYIGKGGIYISLHTDDPHTKEIPTAQNSCEIIYNGYKRIEVCDWLIRTNGTLLTDIWSHQISNINQISFPVCTGGCTTARYMGIGIKRNEQHILLYSGLLSMPLCISNAMTAAFAPHSLSLSPSLFDPDRIRMAVKNNMPYGWTYE